MSAGRTSQDLPSVLTATERAEIEARQDGALPPETRRALRHGSAALADRAEAQAQSRLFDDLARAAVGKAAERHRANRAATRDSRPEYPPNTSGAEPALQDLQHHRSAGLVWHRRAHPEWTDPGRMDPGA
jgi:hypothetical protein